MSRGKSELEGGRRARVKEKRRGRSSRGRARRGARLSKQRFLAIVRPHGRDRRKIDRPAETDSGGSGPSQSPSSPRCPTRRGPRSRSSKSATSPFTAGFRRWISSPATIAGLTLAQVHLGLYHYYENQKAIDAELAKDAEFNRTDSLKAPSMTLPSVRRASLLESTEPSPKSAEKGPGTALASPGSDEAEPGKGMVAPRANRGPWGLRRALRLTSRGKAPDGAPG